MTQTITPNHDPRYTVVFVEHDEYAKPVRVIEEPVTAWLHETNEESSAISVRPLHPSNHLPGARHLKRPAGRLIHIGKGHVMSLSVFVENCRRAGILRKDIHVLNPAEWGGGFDSLDD